MRKSCAKKGSTLVVTLVTLTALALMAAYSMRRAAPGVRLAHQNAAWQEAKIAAEAGIDSAMHDLALNATGFSPGAWTGWQEGDEPPQQKEKKGLLDTVLDPLAPVTNTLTSALGLNVESLLRSVAQQKTRTKRTTPEQTVSTKSLFLDNVRVSAQKGLPAEVDVQLWALRPASSPHSRWFRIRSAGTCPLPPTANEIPVELDGKLRRFSLKNVRPSLQRDDVGKDTTIPLPNVSRVVEVLVEPILSFELALWTGERIVLPNTGNWIIDSFDSTDPLKSANGGRYPGVGSPMVQANASVASNARPSKDAPSEAAIAANGTQVLGAVATNGGDDPTTKEPENVTGTAAIDPARIYDNFNRPMIPMVRPEGEFLPLPANGILRTGSLDAPRIYSVRSNLSDFQIWSQTPDEMSAVVIMVDGNVELKNRLIVPQNVIAVLWVRGDLTFHDSVNSGAGSSNRASQFLIFGDAAAPRTQTLRVLNNAVVSAAFYGANTRAILDGTVNWIGSLNALSFRTATSGNGGIHYDESLATIGPTVGFRIVRYVEDVRE